MNIFGYRVTIVKVDRPNVGVLPVFSWNRRKLARRVVAYCKDHHRPTDPYNGKIGKIKAVRNLTRCGLVEGKNWVELAFSEYGSGEGIE